MTPQIQACTPCGHAPTKKQLARRWLLRFAIGISALIVVALGEVWIIERAPELSVAVDAAANNDSGMTPIRQLERASPPVAVLH